MNTNATADIIASLKSGVSVNATAENTGKPIHTVLNVYKTSAELAQLRQANLLAKQNRKVIHPKDLPYVKAVLAGEMTQTEAAEKWGVKQSWVSLQVSRATANEGQAVEKIHRAVKRLAALRKVPYEQIVGQLLEVRANETRSKRRSKPVDPSTEM